MCDKSNTLCSELLPKREVLKSTDLLRILTSKIGWNDQLFPSLDLSGPPRRIRVQPSDVNNACIMIYNQSKATILEPSTNTDGAPVSVHIVNCVDTTVYISDAVRFVTIAGCTDCEIITMAVTGGMTINSCDKVTVRSVSASLRFENSTDCFAYVYTSRAIILTADTRGLTLAPFNVAYSLHESILNPKTGLYPDESHSVTWALPICCTLSDPGYTLLAPDKIRLVNFPEFQPSSDAKLAICWPEVYATAFRDKLAQNEILKSEICAIQDETSVNKVNAIISGHFREWLTTNNKTKTMIDIIKQTNNN